MMLQKRLAAMLLALVMLLSVTGAMAEDATTPQASQQPAGDEDIVLATVNGEQITKSMCDDFIDYYASSYTFGYSEAVDNLVFDKVITDKITELGFDQYTDEEKAAFIAQAQQEWDAAIQSYVDYFLTEDTDEARALVLTQANDYYTSYGYSVEMLANNIQQADAYERFVEYLVGEDAVTQEAIQAEYDAAVASQKEMIGDSAEMYEMYNYYYGDMYYIPAGYRTVLHILLQADAELATALETAQNSYEELMSSMDAQDADAQDADAQDADAQPADAQPDATVTDAPAEPTAAPVTQEQVDEAAAAVESAKAAILASKQAQIDDIITRLDAGEDFVNLVEEYNEDPGLDVSVGYDVHPTSIMWDTAFRDAAFSDKMLKVGDHSDPVVGSYGVHILYYMADVAEGGLPMTEAVREEIRSALEQNLVNQAQNAAYHDWVGEYTIVKDDEAIAQLDAQLAQ